MSKNLSPFLSTPERFMTNDCEKFESKEVWFLNQMGVIFIFNIYKYFLFYETLYIFSNPTGEKEKLARKIMINGSSRETMTKRKIPI